MVARGKGTEQEDVGGTGMIYQWKLPDVGEGIHEAEIVRWRVREGDWVEVDQVLLEVQTDKATVEIPSPVGGRILRLHGVEGEIVPVGTILVEIETDRATGGDGERVVGTDVPGSASVDPVRTPDELDPPSDTPVARRRVKATPAVRRLARELGIDLRLVAGSGPGGRVMEEDVRTFVLGRRETVSEPSRVLAPDAGRGMREEIASDTRRDAETPSTPAEERIPLRGVRRVIAEHMVRSTQTIPHVTGMDEADVTELVALRQKILPMAEDQRVNITYLPFVIKAVVSALKAYPYFNASVDDERGEIVLKRVYHIGIAVDAPDGLVVPVIRDADRKSIVQLAKEIEELKEKARTRSLTPGDMRDGTFTISNIGSFGGMFATPIIHYPQAAILATGKIVRRPVILEDDRVIGRYMMPVSLTFDHRIIDGGMSGRFMAHVIRLLRHPLWLLMNL